MRINLEYVIEFDESWDRTAVQLIADAVERVLDGLAEGTDALVTGLIEVSDDEQEAERP